MEEFTIVQIKAINAQVLFETGQVYSIKKCQTEAPLPSSSQNFSLEDAFLAMITLSMPRISLHILNAFCQAWTMDNCNNTYNTSQHFIFYIDFLAFGNTLGNLTWPAIPNRHVQKTPFFMDPHARLTKGGLLVPRTLVCL